MAMMLLRAAAGRKANAAPAMARAFSGNVEYPRVEGSVADITKALNSIGSRLSIPTAALYLTEDKINHVVREMKGKDELKEVQRALLLCDAKLAYPSQFAVGTFVSAAIKQGAPELALELLQKGENVRHYVSNQSVVRLARHYAEQEDQEQVDELWKLVQDKGLPLTTKAYHFRAINAKNQGKFDEAVAIAKQAAEVRQINSNLIIQLLSGLEGDELKQQIPLAKYLATKGEVYANTRLSELLAEQ